MKTLRRLYFSIWYFLHPPWDNTIVPPELEDFIRTHGPGRALDLGCGTGTSSIALAKTAWQVTGVDFVPRAIKKARQRAAREKVKVDFRVADVLHLHGMAGLFDLALDIGCFHNLTHSQRIDYLHNLDNLLAPGGIWMVYGFIKTDSHSGTGIRPADIELAQTDLELLERKDGIDNESCPSAWFWFKKIK